MPKTLSALVMYMTLKGFSNNNFHEIETINRMNE